MTREMKNSGIEWIGEIPVEWEIVRIGTQYTERKTKVSDRNYPPLSVSMKGIVPQLATVAKTDAHDDRKLVCKGDFAINSRSDRRGSCGISAYDGSVSLINTILCPRDKMNTKYYDWLFHSIMFSDEFYKWGHGIVNDLWTTNWQDMKKITIPEPPLSEQEKIALFLDQKCAEIDAVIEKTKATIEEYKKLKQSVITEAVTKGIRGNRPMKDSGIEWIEEIPNDWKVFRLKNIANSFSKGNGITKEDTNINGDTPCVRYGEIYTKYNQSFKECLTRTNLSIINTPRYFSYGDILFTCTGELIEEIGKSIVYLGNDSCLAGGDIIILNHSQHPAFLNYVLNSSYAQAQKSCNKTKLKVVHISASEIGNILVALPLLEEQQEIAIYLDQKCAEIDTLITKKTDLLTELETYKKSLIYEYVTGKKEVGEVEDNTTVAIIYPYFPTTINAKNSFWALLVLISGILDKYNYNIGRVKLEKTLHVVQNLIGFDLDNEYVRAEFGPLDNSLFKCEGKLNKETWIKVIKENEKVYYKPGKKKNEYQKYYRKYFAEYDTEINRIINIFKNYNTKQSEIIATLFAAWNDAIIDKKQFTDEDIVDDILNNWHESKRKISKDVWLRAMDEMRKNNLVPKGYGKKTVIKNDTM